TWLASICAGVRNCRSTGSGTCMFSPRVRSGRPGAKKSNHVGEQEKRERRHPAHLAPIEPVPRNAPGLQPQCPQAAQETAIKIDQVFQRLAQQTPKLPIAFPEAPLPARRAVFTAEWYGTVGPAGGIWNGVSPDNQGCNRW